MKDYPHPNRTAHAVDRLAREALQAISRTPDATTRTDAVRRCRDAWHAGGPITTAEELRRAQRLRIALLFRAEGAPAGAISTDDLVEVLELCAQIDHPYSPTHDHRFDDLGEALR